MNNIIKVINASENNLKNINVEIPKNKLVVFSGVSGSGKTTLAFDTLYKEGQRRYIESLSSYARQFLGSFEKPKVEKIEGLAPAISVDQKTRSNNPRSTVGTITEIYDFLRLLFAGISKPYDLKTNTEIKKYSPQDVTKFIINSKFEKIQILFPVSFKSEKDFQKQIERVQSYERGYFNNKHIISLSEFKASQSKGTFYVNVSRLLNNQENKSRIYESIEHAYLQGKGFCLILLDDNEFYFNEEYNFYGSSKILKEPRLFSFNTPLGACPHCNGLGYKKIVDEKLFLDYNKNLFNGGIIPLSNADNNNLIFKTLKEILSDLKIDRKTKIKDIDPKALNIILYGDNKISYQISSKSGNTFSKTGFEGLINMYNRRFMETESDWIRSWIEGFMTSKTCSLCNGNRLNQIALSFKINGLNISEIANLSIEKAINFFSNLKLTNEEKAISFNILNEINSRLKYLNDVGLSYLTLSRNATTLSGGEAQRIRLATQIGSNLSGVLYVLDEPSIGLHQKDNDLLIKTLKNMRDLNNSVLVVEHDDETIMQADYVIDIGPKAGINGGELIFAGTPKELLNCDKSLTGNYLSGKKKIEIPKNRIKADFKESIKVIGASQNNLKNINVEIPLHLMTVVTGVSGSGKSSLVNEVILGNLKSKLYKNKTEPGKVSSFSFKGIKKIIEISQDPIGETPRSNPATYTGVFDHIRELFAQTMLSRTRGYDKGRFSFNLKGGRCANCKGDGEKRIQMHFLPDVYVKCEECHGKRYNDETLDIKYKDKTIYDILEMTIDDACIFFSEIPKLSSKLNILKEVGIGYLKLGQPAPSLSGGEAQRIKLGYELCKNITTETLYILDEPTTGLHPDDVNNLLKVLRKIVNKGASIIIIEHNLDVIKSADYIIDLGPDGGDKGGEVVAFGTPEEVALSKKGYTSIYLKKLLNL